MSKVKVYITPTTHWDREWVMTFGQFQVRLVNLFDHLMEIMEVNQEYCFLFDGQAIALEDFLEIKPEQRERMIHFMKKGQLIAGPWYVLADQFLENGESAIRNLIFGMDIITKLGGRPMMLGYVPDSFGSIASLPMLLQGFGIRYASFGRGRPFWNDQLPKYEFWWEGPDGSRVLAANHGYGNGVFLSYPDIWVDIHQPDLFHSFQDAILERLMKELKAQKEKAATKNLYLSVGIDHMEPRESLPGLLKHIRELQDEYIPVYGTPEEYLKAVEKDAANLMTYRGEMRGSEENSMDLIGTLSSHIYLKQLNDTCEILIQRQVEPLWSMVTCLTGIAYPKGHLQKMWKLLLQNHPHDSICGCSIDQVHKDMQNRYEQIQNISSYLIKDGLHHLLAYISTATEATEAVALTVVNPLGRSHSGPVKGLIRVPKRFNHLKYYMVDAKGEVIPCKVRHLKDKNKDLESVYMTNLQLATVLSKDAIAERADDQVFSILEVDFIANEVPEIGYKTFWLKPGSSQNSFKPGVRLCEDGMENDYIKVVFNKNGTFDMTDKYSGHIFHGLNYFVDREDVGNLYDHHEFAVPHELDTRNCEAVWHIHEQENHYITFRTVIPLELPKEIQEGKRSFATKAMPLTVYTTIYENISRVEIAVELDNVCKDHCLRAAFDTGLDCKFVSAYDHFNVIERKVGSGNGEWRDEPFQEFTDISDGVNGICISTKGLPAYEAVKGEKGTKLFLTLLRSVGMIGPAAGSNYATQEGQCQRALRFEYAIYPHSGDWRTGDCLGNAIDYRTPFLIEADLQHIGVLPSFMSFLSLKLSDKKGDMEPVRSILKMAEDDNGMILRLWNPGESIRLGLTSEIPLKGICLSSLNECTIEKLDSVVNEMELKSNGLTTLRILV